MLAATAPKRNSFDITISGVKFAFVIASRFSTKASERIKINFVQRDANDLIVYGSSRMKRALNRLNVCRTPFHYQNISIHKMSSSTNVNDRDKRRQIYNDIVEVIAKAFEQFFHGV